MRMSAAVCAARNARNSVPRSTTTRTWRVIEWRRLRESRRTVSIVCCSTSDGREAGRPDEAAFVEVGRRDAGALGAAAALGIVGSCWSGYADAKILVKPDVYFLGPSNKASVTSPLAVRMSTKSTLRLVSSSAAESSSEIAADVNKLGEEDVPGYLVVLVDDAMAPYKTGVRLPVDETHLHLTDVRCIDNPYAYISAVLNPSRGFLRQALRAV